MCHMDVINLFSQGPKYSCWLWMIYLCFSKIKVSMGRANLLLVKLIQITLKYVAVGDNL